ncbi:MAG: TonB family protein, partial [Bryobacteraceae bacterium]
VTPRAMDGKAPPAECVEPKESATPPAMDGRARAESTTATRQERAPAAPARVFIPAEELPSPAEPEQTGPMASPVLAGMVEAAEGQPRAMARVKRSRAVLGVLGVVVLGLAGAALWQFTRGGAPAPAPESSSLNLRVERSGGQLLLSWNRSLPILQTAQRAILSISDGDHHEDVEMDLGQLRSGSIVYSPITSDVSFRLEVTDLKNGKSVSESVRVLGGKPSPTGPPAENAPERPAQSEAATDATKPARPQPRNMAPLPSLTKESLAARLSPVEPIPAAAPAAVPAPAAPVPVATAAAAPSVPPEAGLTAVESHPQQAQQAAAQPPAPAVSQAKPAAAPAASASQQPAPAPVAATKLAETPARVGGQVQEARLIRRREPVYPPLARQARIQGTVRLEAVIGPDGRVEKVEAISGPPLLRQAAVDAVKQWVYEPSRLNGQPVRVTTQIEINFTLGR